MKRIFTYEEAAAMLPEVQRLTEQAMVAVDDLVRRTGAEDPENLGDAYTTIVAEWAASIVGLGIEVKGVWLIDFDNGSGYYCWKYPEPALEFFHGYEEGYRGRVRLN